MSEAVGKTPVSELQDRCSIYGIIPNYEFVRMEGPDHAPTYWNRVTVAGVSAVGKGGSKKKAKQAAAQALLAKMAAVEEEDGLGVGNNSTTSKAIPGNPVGMLQEMCTKLHWFPPRYEMVDEQGFPHMSFFTIACVILQHRETGTGKSKKIAKKQAAHKMLEKLHERPISSYSILPGLDDADNDEICAGSRMEFSL